MKTKDFLIFKNTKKTNEKSPDYELTIKVEGKFVKIGGVWIRESSKGTKFFSCKLSEPYQDRKSYSLVLDEKTGKDSGIDELEF